MKGGSNFLRLDGRPVLYLLILSLLGVAYWNRFVQDDAFISFRYAQHLVEGHGLVWNIGENPPVEGYTNFLWVLLIAVGMLFGLSPDTWSMVLGAAAAVGTLLVTYRLARRYTGSAGIALLVVFLLGTNYTFSAYVTGGLETQLQAFLVVLSFDFASRLRDDERQQSLRRVMMFSLLVAAAVVTRMDSVLLSGVAWLWVADGAWRDRSRRVALLAGLVIPGLLVALAWFGFKLMYYGEILPNTVYVKVTEVTPESLTNGLRYVWTFFSRYGGVVPALLALVYLRRLMTRRLHALLVVASFLWVGYLIKVEGGFMEYRLMVPIMPLLAVLLAQLLHVMGSVRWNVAIASALVLSSTAHAMTYWGREHIESIDELKWHVIGLGADFGWKFVGQALRQDFGGVNPPPVIATTAAGAIPYFSGMPTVDMLGLNDRWVARHGQHIDALPGHSRYATLEYMLAQGVSLVVGHPKILPIDSERHYSAREMFQTTYFHGPFDMSALPGDVRVIELPIAPKHIAPKYKVAVLYLQSNPAIDQAIRERGLTVYTVAE